MAAQTGPEPAARGNVFTRKIGPLPMWGWVAIIVAGILAYRWWSNRNTSTTSSGSATTPAVVVTTPPEQEPAGSRDPGDGNRHKPRGPGGGREFRHVATGKETLAEVARARHTTVAELVAVTRASREISPENLRKFLAYAKHPNRKMPAGLVYYTATGTAGQGGGGNMAAPNG